MAETKRTKKDKRTCFYCGNDYVETNYYKSNSQFYSNIGKIPYCKQCIEKLYKYHFEKYTNEGCLYPEKKAIKRICMALDIYYTDKVYNSAMNKVKESSADISPMGQYMRIIQLSQYNNEKQTYENTITKEEQKEMERELAFDGSFDDVSENIEIKEETINFFGKGFDPEDYIFLKKEYDDWTARHECKTKSQEEIFKDICFNRLQNLKALQRGEDTKDITASFQKLLDSGKLQPKQNAGDAMADNQTFGTLIHKWENTRPIPEVDEDLRDVDKIGLYLEIFFKGHLAKMMGLKNGLSNLYTKFMKKYTVEKPEYNDNEDGEALFDAIFGNVQED